MAAVAIAPTASGHGYWVASSNGAVDSYGDAPSYGSLASANLNAAVIAMAATPTGGGGYWLLARDGGMFSFGQAGFHGSLPGLGWCPSAAQAVAFTGTLTGLGYWVVLADGRVVAFGDAEHFGDAPPKAQPVAFAVAP